MAQYKNSDYRTPQGSSRPTSEIVSDLKSKFIFIFIAGGTAPLLDVAWLVVEIQTVGSSRWLLALVAAVGLIAGAYKLLAWSALLRRIYFGAYTVAVTTYAFTIVEARGDWVWAATAAAVVFALGCWATYTVVTADWY